ncbi:MAG: DUF1491 family protein [Pseudomonadota bacterium]
MSEARLRTGLWVEALLRRVQLAGSAAFVLQKGDAERGDVLIKVAALDGMARAFVPTVDFETGARIFEDLASRGIEPTETAIDEYVARAKDRDRDLWIVEIEDREGRHFLTEPVEIHR